MLRSLSGPSSSIGSSRRPAIRSITAADTSTPPIGACSCRRDTTLMPSPRRSVPSTVTSPMWMAQRSSSRTAVSSVMAGSATAACTASAARVASTGPVNSTSSPSPSALKMRPPPAVISGSIAWRSARHAPSTRSSSASTRALKLTTSNATTTTSRRPPFAALPALAFARLRAMRADPRLTMEPLRASPFAPDSCAPEAWRHRDEQALRAPIEANAAGSCRKGTPAETACG